MSRQEAALQYDTAMKNGQKYCRAALRRGEYPYPLVLDDILPADRMRSQEDLGRVDIPSELIIGTKSAGRTAAFSGDFMPLLPMNSEFAAKWITLCEAHLDSEGIQDPIRCYEYMGYFYVLEGNKRVSVLKSYASPTVPGYVTRIVPEWSDDRDVQAYYEFMRFYRLSRLYGVVIRQPRGYARLQTLLGYEPDHVWTRDERRRFLSGFALFREAYDKLNTERLPLTAGEALLVWLQVFPFPETAASLGEMQKSLSSVWDDLRAQAASLPIEVKTQPETAEKGLIARVLGSGRQKISAAFIYAFDPEQSAWTRAHEHGRHHVMRTLGERAETRAYIVTDRDYAAAMEQAVADGAEVIFATTPAMIEASRRTAALHSDVRVFDCTLSQPYTGVRTYYCRTYESKFITGAIAGVMAGEGDVGYIAGYPIIGVPAEINAFALGVRLTNPAARVRLAWSCVEGDPDRELREAGITVISNRDATAPGQAHFALDRGIYRLEQDGSFRMLTVPCWNWGGFYEKILGSMLDGVWNDGTPHRAVNYWWGLGSGVLDVQFSDALPEGVKALGSILREGVIAGAVEPFRREITDQDGTLRCDGSRGFSPEEILAMDWLCDAVDGTIPPFEALLPRSRELVRYLGIYPVE